MNTDTLRAAYYCASEIVRQRRRNGQPVPAWLASHYRHLDTAMSLERQSAVRNTSGATQLGHDEIVGTRWVAETLGWSLRRVQRNAVRLGGAKVGRNTVFHAHTIRAFARQEKHDH